MKSATGKAKKLLSTERPSTDHADLDTYPVDQLVAALIDDQARAAVAVKLAQGALARAVEQAVPRIRAGGRLIYVGAGTSGRLGLLDSVDSGCTTGACWTRQAVDSQ